jgi:hypothetical protein
VSATFVFLHVGPANGFPTLLVRSIRAIQPDAEIIQCADASTPAVEGVSSVARFAGDTANLMTFRLHSFAGLSHAKPALYLDTDMLCVSPIDPEAELGEGDVAVCSREFNVASAFNTGFAGLDLSEYNGMTLGEVYPYVACATVTRNGAFWKECLDNLRTLAPKFHYWYGDQEAIRNVISSGRFKPRLLPESLYGCLPEAPSSPTTTPRLMHFKGGHRKPLMLEFARKLGLT